MSTDSLSYVVGGCVCLTLLVVLMGGVGGMLFARSRRKPADVAAMPAVNPPSEPAPDLSETAVAQAEQESVSLTDTMKSDLNATVVNKPQIDLTADLKETIVHSAQKKREQTDDNASAV